jgi:hypothetical protein
MVTKLSISQTSFSGDAILQTGYADDGIVRGIGFVIAKNFTIANAGTLYILFDYTPHTAGAGLIYVMPPMFEASSGKCLVNVYRGTNYAGGTAFKAYNANQLASKAESSTVLTSGPTGTNKGTLALEFLVGQDSQGAFRGGGTSQDISFYVRDNTAKTLVEIVNLSGQEITFHYGQVFYEI